MSHNPDHAAEAMKDAISRQSANGTFKPSFSDSATPVPSNPSPASSLPN